MCTGVFELSVRQLTSFRVDMDCSPAKATPPIASCPSNDHPNDPPVPLVEISCRLVEGLQVETIFPQSAYLDNIKAELTKVLKQR